MLWPLGSQHRAGRDEAGLYLTCNTVVALLTTPVRNLCVGAHSTGFREVERLLLSGKQWQYIDKQSRNGV
jgi:hypothetical protein